MSDVTMWDRVCGETGGAVRKASRFIKEIADRNTSWPITV